MGSKMQIKKERYWNRDLETLDREQLETGQLSDLKKTVARALCTPFYKKRLKDIGSQVYGVYNC